MPWCLDAACEATDSSHLDALSAHTPNPPLVVDPAKTARHSPFRLFQKGTRRGTFDPSILESLLDLSWAPVSSWAAGPGSTPGLNLGLILWAWHSGPRPETETETETAGAGASRGVPVLAHGELVARLSPAALPVSAACHHGSLFACLPAGSRSPGFWPCELLALGRPLPTCRGLVVA